MAQETNQSSMLCAGGCGFYGNPRTSGMCSVCHKDHVSRQNSTVCSIHRLEETLASAAEAAVAAAEEAADCAPAEPFSEQSCVTQSLQSEETKPKKKRCFICSKKLGLTGLRCRCGQEFCGLHRYSEQHQCPFDYRTEAAERLRRDNPLVTADRVQRI